MVDVHEMTSRSWICARLDINASVVPSEKNSWSGSRERFWSGSTATERMRATSVLMDFIRQKAAAPTVTATATSVAPAIASRRRKYFVAGALSSTTLLDPKLNFLQFLNAFQIVRFLRE